jgi:hypothetical protein
MTRISNKPRRRRGPDVMDLLARARPASLDAGPGARQPSAGLAIAEIASLPDGRPRASLLGDRLESDLLGELGRELPGGRPRPQLARPRRSARRVALAGGGLTLIAGAAALAVFAATAGTAAAPSRPGHSTASGHVARALSARNILLTAAANAAAGPAVGRYWRVEMVSGSLMAAGPNAHPYAVEQRWSDSTSWDARSARQRTWTFPAAGYASLPATPAAAAVWQADGSPTLPSTHGKQQAWWQTGGAVGYFGNENLTFTQFQRLPSDPARLAAVVRRAAIQQNQTADPVRGGNRVRFWSIGPQPALGQDMFGIYVQLLKWDPITPQVRATVFQLIAGLAGVRSIGRVTDPLGRTGYGIVMSSGEAAGEEEVLVIAPGSGELLADEYVVTSLPAGVRSSASGAVTGLASCPAGSTLIKRQSCVGGVRVARIQGHLEIRGLTGSSGKIAMVGLGPRLALAPGQVDSYDAVISAGWTSASPQLPPRSQQFSVVADGKG